MYILLSCVIILAKDGRGDEDPENVVKKRQGEERAGDLA